MTTDNTVYSIAYVSDDRTRVVESSYTDLAAALHFAQGLLDEGRAYWIRTWQAQPIEPERPEQ